MPWNSKKLKLEVGQKFTHLIIIKFITKDERGRKFYLCKCDCGIRKIVQASLLKNGNTKSCGCKTTKLKQLFQTLPNNGGSVGQILAYYHTHARKRGKKFELTREQFDQLIRLPCHYCGILWSNTHMIGQFNYNGVDRVDNDLGYTISNTVPCCSTCNRAKRDMSKTKFLAWIKSVYQHQADQWT